MKSVEERIHDQIASFGAILRLIEEVRVCVQAFPGRDPALEEALRDVVDS